MKLPRGHNRQDARNARMSNWRRGGTAVAAVLVALLVSGCAGGTGYSHKPLYDPSVRTVAAPIFENRTFYREMEFRLTEALVKEIEQVTPYKVTGEGAADTIITGTILAVNQRLLSRQLETGVAQEVQLIVTASFEWKDLRTGKVLRKRSRVEASGEYLPVRGAGEPLEVARLAAVGELAREIVDMMAGDW